MQKTDLTREHKQYYKAKQVPELVTIGPGLYITTEGTGAPDSPVFKGKIKALYATAYNIKKINKLQEKDFKVAALEGHWWTESGAPVSTLPVSEWRWKLSIQLPPFVEAGDFRQAVALAGNKKLAHLDELELESRPGTLAVQILHIGSYYEENSNIRAMTDYISRHNLEVTGPHHEIYLSDPTKTAVEKLKTILRMDVK